MLLLICYIHHILCSFIIFIYHVSLTYQQYLICYTVSVLLKHILISFCICCTIQSRTVLIKFETYMITCVAKIVNVFVCISNFIPSCFKSSILEWTYQNKAKKHANIRENISLRIPVTSNLNKMWQNNSLIQVYEYSTTTKCNLI